MNPEPADHPDQNTIFNRFAHHYAVSPVHRSGPDLAVLLKLSAPNSTDVALDVATGTGHTALAIGAAAAEAVGIDLSPEMLTEARRLAAEEGRTNVRFELASAESLPFAAKSFTLVTARHAPHHFTSVDAFLSEVARVLRPEGRFVLADQVSPAAEDQPWVDEYETVRDPSHHRQRTPAAWRDLAQKAGLVLRDEQLVSYDLDFAWWTKQAGCSPEQIQRLEELAQGASPATAARMELKFDQAGRLQSHRMQVLVARYEREGEEGQNMDIKRSGSQPSRKGPAEYFTGTVRIDPLFEANDPARALGVSVTFEPGTRTAWHSHPLGQTLIVTAGCGLVQREGGPVEQIRPGDVVWFPPGEKHWHGATPTTAMTHIAIQEKLDGKAADWMEQVSDEQYRA